MPVPAVRIRGPRRPPVSIRRRTAAVWSGLDPQVHHAGEAAAAEHVVQRRLELAGRLACRAGPDRLREGGGGGFRKPGGRHGPGRIAPPPPPIPPLLCPTGASPGTRISRVSRTPDA